MRNELRRATSGYATRDVVDVAQARSRAIVATIAALALVNAGLAGLIAFAVGARSLAPLWVLLVLVVAGAVVTYVAFLLWRAYLACVRR